MDMDPPSIANAGAPSTAHAVMPLTASKRDGTPYKRFEDVEAQIQVAIASDPLTWQIGKLKSETLVYLARWLWPQGNDLVLGRVIDCLGRRIARIARDFLGDFAEPVATELVSEIAQEVNLRIFVTEQTRQSEFLEVAFRMAVQRRVLNAVERYGDRARTEVVASTFERESDDEDDDGLLESFPDGERTPLESAIGAERIQTALDAVTDKRHREAAILRYCQGWPISDTDADNQTLCSHFGKSPRQIQNWLNRALKEMRAALGSDV